MVWIFVLMPAMCENIGTFNDRRRRSIWCSAPGQSWRELLCGVVFALLDTHFQMLGHARNTTVHGSWKVVSENECLWKNHCTFCYSKFLGFLKGYKHAENIYMAMQFFSATPGKIHNRHRRKINNDKIWIKFRVDFLIVGLSLQHVSWRVSQTLDNVT